MLLGVYNTYQLTELSSEVDSVKQSPRHILQALKGLTDVTGKITQDINGLTSALEEMEVQSLRSHYEAKLERTGLNMLDAAKDIRDDINDVLEGVYQAMKGLFSPKLVRPEDILTGLKQLDVKAG